MSAELNFSGRTAVITGAAKGLGRAYALWLAHRGCNLVVNNRRAPDGSSSASAVVDEIQSAGGRAAAHDGPVETEESAAQMMAVANKHFGSIDILICNAGVVRFRDFNDTAIRDMRQLIEINLWGSLYPIKAAWPSMLADGYGRVILTGSSAGFWGQPQSADYALTKAAMIGLARAIALDTPSGKDICTNVIAPAAYTPMSAFAFGERWAEYASANKVAPIVGWLASDQCHSSGGLYHAGAGRVRRVQILEGPMVELSDGPITEIMARLHEAPEHKSSYASGGELMHEMAAAAKAEQK